MAQFVFMVNNDFFSIQTGLPSKYLMEYNQSQAKRRALEDIAVTGYNLTFPEKKAQRATYICTVQDDLSLVEEKPLWLN